MDNTSPGMDFSLSEEQKSLRREVVEFAHTLNDGLEERDRDGTFSPELWRRCADFGLLGLPLPRTYGGAEHDLLTTVVALEGLGYGCRDGGLLLGLNAQLWTVQLPILKMGNEEQKERFLPALCQGRQIATHALTEPEAGSDAFSLRTTATPCPGGYRLKGRKRLITFAPIADLALVFATVDPSKGRWGITAFLVESDSEGFEAGTVQSKMGLRTVPIGELTFRDVFVPERNRLGPEGGGLAVSTTALEYDRCGILASHLGAMERQLEQAVAYAQTRRQFGRPIGAFQSVAHRIADMRLRLETCRLLLYKVAWLKDQNRQATLESALLKLHLAESFLASSLDAVRIHGGVGYLSETGVERDLRDSVGGVIYAGTSDIQRNIVARMCGL